MEITRECQRGYRDESFQTEATEDKETATACYHKKEFIHVVNEVVEKATQNGLSAYMSESVLRGNSVKEMNNPEGKGMGFLHESPNYIKQQENTDNMAREDGSDQSGKVEEKRTEKVGQRRNEITSVAKIVVRTAIQRGLNVYISEDPQLKRPCHNSTDERKNDIKRSESIELKKDNGSVMAVEQSSKGKSYMNVDGQTSSEFTNVTLVNSNPQYDNTCVRKYAYYKESSSKTITVEKLLRDQASLAKDTSEPPRVNETELKPTKQLLADIQNERKAVAPVYDHIGQRVSETERATNETEKLRNEARKLEFLTRRKSVSVNSSPSISKNVYLLGTQEKRKEEILINDSSNTSLQQSGTYEWEFLDGICEELFGLCLDVRSEDKETKEQIEFALAHIAQKDCLEATQVACLNGTVDELQDLYFQLVQSYKRTTELDDYNIDINEAIVLEPSSVDVKRSSLEYIVGKCRKLGTAIARLGCNIKDDMMKRKEVYHQQHRVMKRKARQMNKSFSETLLKRDERIQTLIETSEQMKECLDDANSEKISIEALINSIAIENEKLQDEVEALRQQQITQREVYKEELENMAAQKKFREREICNLRRDLQRKENQIDELQHEYDTALSREKVTFLTVEEVRAECSKTEEQLNQMEMYFAELERVTEKLLKQTVEKTNTESKNRNSTSIHMPKDNVGVPPRREDQALDEDAIKQPKQDIQPTRYEVQSEYRSLPVRNSVSLQRLHNVKEAIENTAAMLGYFRNKAITLECEKQNAKQEILRQQQAVEENIRPQDADSTEEPYKTNTASFHKEHRTKISSELWNFCALTPEETMLNHTRNVCGKSKKDGALRDWNANTSDNDLYREWSLIKEMKGEALETSRFLTELRGEHGASKINDYESNRDYNTVVEANREELQRHESEKENFTLYAHHIRLLQADLDEAREEMLQKNKEICELKSSNTLLELKLREQDITEQELRSNIKQLSTRCLDLEKDMSVFRRNKSYSITQRFAGQLL